MIPFAFCVLCRRRTLYFVYFIVYNSVWQDFAMKKCISHWDKSLKLERKQCNSFCWYIRSSGPQRFFIGSTEFSGVLGSSERSSSTKWILILCLIGMTQLCRRRTLSADLFNIFPFCVLCAQLCRRTRVRRHRVPSPLSYKFLHF